MTEQKEHPEPKTDSKGEKKKTDKLVEEITEERKKRQIEKILEFDGKSGLLVPVKWKYPFSHKDYVAIIIGLNLRYEFERIFSEKVEFELEENEKRVICMGFDRKDFKDDLVIEERYSYKEQQTFISKTIYYRITIVDNDVYGERCSKGEIKEFIQMQQQLIYNEFRNIMTRFGEEFTLFTMKSILKQKDSLVSKKVNLLFFE